MHKALVPSLKLMVTIRGQVVSSQLLKQTTEINSNEMTCEKQKKYFLLKVRVTVRVRRSKHVCDMTQNC